MKCGECGNELSGTRCVSCADQAHEKNMKARRAAYAGRAIAITGACPVHAGITFDAYIGCPECVKNPVMKPPQVPKR